MAKFVRQYASMSMKETNFMASFVGFFYLRERNLPIERCYMISGIANQFYKRMGLKLVVLLFCHRRLETMSVHTHAYHYPLFEYGMKTSL